MSGQKEQHGTGLSSLVARGAVLAALASALLVVVDTPLKSLISSSLDYFSLHGSSSPEYDLSGVCQQVPGLSPRNQDAERFIRDKVESPAYHTEIINKLTRIIQIPSES